MQVMAALASMLGTPISDARPVRAVRAIVPPPHPPSRRNSGLPLSPLAAPPMVVPPIPPPVLARPVGGGTVAVPPHGATKRSNSRHQHKEIVVVPTTSEVN